MGRITVFSSTDLNSQRVKLELDKRGIPYTDVSVAIHPSVRASLKSLAFSDSTPQVFFNTRCVGGLDNTLSDLQKWDGDKKFKSARDKYEAQIGKAGDPVAVMAAIPTENAEVVLAGPEIRKAALSIELPDGTMTTVTDITQKLKNTLPKLELKYKNGISKNSFSGESAARIFEKSIEISEKSAVAFGQRLLESKIIQHVAGAKEFNKSETSIYRLQCFNTPEVLNSFCLWTEGASNDALGTVVRLEALLRSVEDASLDSMGKLDMKAAATHENYAAFEEAACELQAVSISNLEENEMLALGINLYQLMVRYAFIKIGMPTTETDRLHLLSHVKFNVGGLFYTFQEWVDGVLRGNKKATYCSKVPFNSLDQRKKLAVSKLDYRIHFALNLCSRMGSTYSLPFTTFSAENVDQELDLAARVFCTDDSNVLIKKNVEILLSQTFGWYRSDFSKKDIVTLGIISSYLEHFKKSQLERSLESIKTIKFQEIDWSRHASRFNKYDKNSIVSVVNGISKILRRFKPPPAPDNEQVRLATLHSLDILDTLPEERFDRITRMCKEEFDVPLVFISLVDLNRQWFKSKVWACPLPEAAETGRDVSFCGHAILGGDNNILVVENALEDDRFADNPLVTGDLHIRFYAGCTLTIPSADGGAPVNIGSLCIIDQKPRKLTDAEQTKLKKYAAQVKREILRRDSDSGYMSGGD